MAYLYVNLIHKIYASISHFQAEIRACSKITAQNCTQLQGWRIKVMSFFSYLTLLLSMSLVYVCAQSFSCGQPFGTPWTVACQAPLSMKFSRQEYWSHLPFPTPRDLPDPGIKPVSLVPATLATTAPPMSFTNTLSHDHG